MSAPRSVGVIELGDRLQRLAQRRAWQRVRHQHQLGALAEALLDDRLDRRAGVAELLRDQREHARAVVDLHVDVERGDDVLDDLQVLAEPRAISVINEEFV